MTDHISLAKHRLKSRHISPDGAHVEGRRPLPGVRRLKRPLSAGHISELCRGKRQHLCYSPILSAAGRGGGGGK